MAVSKRPRAGKIVGQRQAGVEITPKTTRYVTYQNKQWQVRGRDRATGAKRLTRMTDQGLEEVLVDPAELGPPA